MIGCTPRACEERLKKLRKLGKGWALGDSGETDGERGGGGKNVNGKKRKRGTEEGRDVERGDKGREPLEDVPDPTQEKEESTAATATDIPVVKENAAPKAGVRNQNLHSEHKEFIPALLPASPIKPDPSTSPPTHHRS